MTTAQFNRLSESFALYANKETTYKSLAFSRNGKKIDHKGFLMGIGIGHNEGRVILAYAGSTYAIPFADVKLPKLAWE